ncbi:hypothetical protein Tco_0903484 [Tanacetum coccineum]
MRTQWTDHTATNSLYPPSDDVIVISSDDKDDEEKDIPLDDEDDIASTPVQIQVPALGRKRVYYLIDESDSDEE